MPISYSCPKCGFLSTDASAAHACSPGGGLALKRLVVEVPPAAAPLLREYALARVLLRRALAFLGEVECGTLAAEVAAYLDAGPTRAREGEGGNDGA